MGTRPTDFPGLVIDLNRQCVVNQIELARFPVRVCECFSDCTNPGAPFPMLTECFIYGVEQGDLDKGCPVITDGALGVTVGFLETHFLVRLDLGADTDFLQSPGANVNNTAFRFNLYIGKPVGIYEVYLLDKDGNRAFISFEPAVGSVLWVNIRLADFTFIDAGVFDLSAVRYVYFGFTNNFQVADCMMALDNVRICTNEGGGVGGFSFNPDSEPYGQNNAGDVCVMLEDFDSEMALERVICDAAEPGPPSPEICDECVVGPPLIDGNGAIHFCVDNVPSPFYPPSIRYIPIMTFALVTDVTFTVYSWRPGVNVRVVLVDFEGRRAIYDFVAVGGSQTVTAALLTDFTYPDGAFDVTRVAEWWTIFGMAGVNSDDRFALDEMYTNGGAVLIHDMSTLSDIYCGYTPEPVEPNTTVECEWATMASILASGDVSFDVLTWTGPLTITTVSQLCTEAPGYWDLGFDDPMMPASSYTVRIAFNIPALPPSLSMREVILTLFDEAGRELMMRLYPKMSGSPWTPSVGDNLISFYIVNNAGQPTLESKGKFNGRKVKYWQLGFIGMEVDPAVYPFTINFEGFEFGLSPALPFAPTKQFLFNDYAGGKTEFEAKGGYSCYEDWRLVEVAPDATSFTFLAGAGVTVDMDPSFVMNNIGVDRGKIPLSDNRTDMRTEVYFNDNGFNPGYENWQGWSNMDLRYRARPDSGAPCDMWFVIRDVLGKTATYKFDSHAGGPPILPVDQWRQFSTSRSNMNMPMGDIQWNWWRHFRVVKERIPNQPRTDIPPTGRDQFTGDELDFLRVQTDGPPAGQAFNAKCGVNTVDAVRVGEKWSSIMCMGGDDQPDFFNGHVHHETDCGWSGGNLTGDPPPGWPYSSMFPFTGPDMSPYHEPFEGWLKINKLVEGEGVMRVQFSAPINLTAEYADPLSFFQIFAFGTGHGVSSLSTIAKVRLVLRDGVGGTASIDLGTGTNPLTSSGLLGSPQGWNPANIDITMDFKAEDRLYAMLFRLSQAVDLGIDWSAVTGYELMTTEAGDGWRSSKTWFFQDCYGQFYSPTLIHNWSRSTWSNLIGFQNPSNQFSVGKALDPLSTPVVALNCDRTKKIAYWGMDEDWIRTADIVMVPAKYKNDSIVGINGNRGYDEFGMPLPGVLEALARDTLAWYGNAAFRIPPFAGCRNIWMDLCYIERVVCLGEDMEKTWYEFWDADCGCILPEDAMYVSNLVTHYASVDPITGPVAGWLDRILPDDQFIIEVGAQPLPSGYEEAIYFEYCNIPDCDQEVTDDTDPDFKITRRTPTCSKPDDPLNVLYGYYRVEVEVEAKTAPVTINWADVLNPGETLISGVMAGVITLIAPGDTHKWEYIIRTAQPQAGSIVITGAAWAVLPPITLVSPAITMDVNCATLSWNQFGSQNPNVYGEVFWAGGGRPDPVIPSGVNLWTKMWAGPGSAGLSKREQYLFSDATVPQSAGLYTFQLGGTGIEGFALDIPVWIFNTAFVDNPARKITGLDIENQERMLNPNEEITGLYGKVISIDGPLKTITVLFNTPPDQPVRFTMLASACIMVAPDQSRGYYWEASPDLVDLCKMLPIDGLGVAELRWGFRYWNSTRYPAIETQGAGYICDGDGESYLYEFHGEAVKDIINPVDWMDLLCSPVQETKLSNDALPTQDDIRVCDYCLFEPCSIVQIVDENCTGKEGSGPGYIGSVSLTTPDDLAKTCATLYAAEGHLKIIPAIPVAVTGCGVIDGFKTTRRARAFVKPDVARYAYSPTTKVDINGVPVEGQNFVGVDFATGLFTFIPGIVVSNPCACFKALNSSVKIEPLDPGIYFLKGIDKSGCKSPPSKPIKVVGLSPEPEDCGIGQSPTLLFHKTLVGSDEEYGGGGVYTPINNSSFTFNLPVSSRVEIRVSVYRFDVLVGSLGALDESGRADLWAHDMSSVNYYHLGGRYIMGIGNGDEAVKADSGAGAVMSRVIDLPGKTSPYVFDLGMVTSGWAGTKGLFRYPMDIQVWRYGACAPPP